MQVDYYRIEIRAVGVYGASRPTVARAELPPLPDLSNVIRTLTLEVSTSEADQWNKKLRAVWLVSLSSNRTKAYVY